MKIIMKTQNGHNSAFFEATTSIFCMVMDLNDTYKMMVMMTRMMKTQNGHNSANFEATTSRYCVVIDVNDIYRMMMTIMIMMLMTQMMN